MRTLFLAACLAALTAACGAPGPAARPTIGSLVTRDHVVVVEQSPDGLRYSIETRDGSFVAEDLTLEELLAIAPGAARHLETGTARLIAE